MLSQLMIPFQLFTEKFLIIFVFHCRSGIEEVYTEKDVLLQEVSDICTECHLSPKTKSSKEKQIVEIGRQAREQHALQSFQDKSATVTDHSYGRIIIPGLK